MKKVKKTFLIVLFFALALSGIFVLSIGSGVDAVDKEFSWMWTDGLLDPSCHLIGERKNWHKIFGLSKYSSERLLSDNLWRYDYNGWHRLSGIHILVNGYVLDGKARDIFVNYKKGGDSFSGVRIYLDLTRQEIVLYWGITYGM